MEEKGRKGYNDNPIITEGEHEAIISQELWNKVQTLLKARKRHKRGNNKTDNLLTGLLKCKCCNSNYVISNTINTLKDGSKGTFDTMSAEHVNKEVKTVKNHQTFVLIS